MSRSQHQSTGGADLGGGPYEPGAVKILPCELHDLEQSWAYFRRADLHKLSAVDATRFATMKRARIRIAYTFDHHFAAAGFSIVT